VLLPGRTRGRSHDRRFTPILPMTCPVGVDVERAAAIVIRGGLTAFPTETVYGLGGNALDARAVARIFEAKGRPTFDPLIVHVAEPAWLSRVAGSVPDAARRLIDCFWPGPLTLILPKAADVPDLVTAGLPTVGVRMPAHPLALALLRQCGVPIAAPSANLFGEVSPTTARHVVEQLGTRIDYILDGGPCGIGLESTIIDLSGERPRLLRPGGLALERIEEMLGPVAVGELPSDATDRPLAPGMLARHYAPRTPMVVLAHGAPLPQASRVGLLAFVPESALERFSVVEVLSPRGDLAEAAANLFAAMRRLDALALDLIVARPVPNTGLGRAINDRLIRASHGAT
jgi:L-threonylcarbamoyladenylate synthase